MEIEKAELSRLFLELIESGRKSKNKVVCNDFKVNAFGPGEVGEKQFVILFCITCLNITTITELATYTNQSTGSMSITISKLVDSGHLCKSRRLGENEDKRRVYYEATQKGMALLEKTLTGFVDTITEMLNNLGKRRKKHFISGYMDLRIVISHFEGLEEANNYSNNFFVQSFDAGDEKRIVAELITDGALFLNWFKNRYEKLIMKKPGCNLTFNKLRVMGLLYMEKFNSIKDLAPRVMLSESALSIALSKLNADGYIKRLHPEGGDRRKVIFAVTDEGVAIVERIGHELHELFDGYYSSLDEKVERLILSGLLSMNKALN